MAEQTHGIEEPVVEFTFDRGDWQVQDPIYGGPLQYDTARKVFDVPAAFVQCDSCRSARRLLCTTFDEYFSTGSVTCPSCSDRRDLVSSLTEPFKVDSRDLYFVLALAGATVTSFFVPLVDGVPTRVVLQDHGVPADAVRLEMTYATRVDEPLPAGADPIRAGHLVPIEDTTNNRPRRHVPAEVDLIGGRRGEAPYRPASAAVRVAWIRQSLLPPEFRSVLQAASLFYEVQTSASLIWANTAVESALSQLMHGYFLNHASKDRVERFLTDAATYSHQLNVLLPMLASLCGSAVLRPAVVGDLNRLNKLRNKIVHEGADPPADYRERGRLLVTAIVALHYVRYLGSRLPA